MLAAAAPVTCLLLGAALGETRIGILPVNSAGDPGVAHTLTAALVAEMRRSAPSAEVFGPDDVAALMGAGRAGACADVSCFGAMADGAGVDRLVLADLVNLGPDNLLTLTLLDVRRKVVLGSAEDRGQALVPAVTRPGDHQSGDAPEPLDRLASAVARLLASSPASETTGFGRLEVLLDPWPVAAGRLNLKVAQPGALALLDDRPLQIAVSTQVPAGVHRVRVVSTDFKRAQELMVEIKAGASKTISVDLGRGLAGIGRLEVEAEPGTRVDLDGQTLGIAPLAPVAVAEGAHEIRLVHGARGATVQIAVAPHSTVRIAPPLVTDIP